MIGAKKGRSWKHRIGVYVARELYKSVRERAWTERLSMSALVQVWIRRGLDGPPVTKEERC